jgi:hypothetical protein
VQLYSGNKLIPSTKNCVGERCVVLPKSFVIEKDTTVLLSVKADIKPMGTAIVGDKLRISLDTGSQAVLKLQGSASKQVSSDHNDKGIISGFTTITKIPDYAYYLVPATIDVAGLYPTSLSNNTIVKDGRGRFRVASFQINNPSNTNITLIRAAFLDKGSHSTSSEYTLMISDSFPQNTTFGSEVGTTYSYKKTTATSSTWVIDFNSLSNSTGLVIGKGRVVYVTVLRNQYPTEYENWNLFTEPFFDNMPFFSLQYRVNEKDLGYEADGKAGLEGYIEGLPVQGKAMVENLSI